MKCLDEGAKTKPACTCGAGDDAPPAHHYSVRFPYCRELAEQMAYHCKPRPTEEFNIPSVLWPRQDPSKNCPLYIYYKGCSYEGYRKHETSGYACPLKPCTAFFFYCQNHGGIARSQVECYDHMVTDHIYVSRAS